MQQKLRRNSVFWLFRIPEDGESPQTYLFRRLCDLCEGMIHYVKLEELKELAKYRSIYMTFHGQSLQEELLMQADTNSVAPLSLFGRLTLL
jgi:hypothetical protein